MRRSILLLAVTVLRVVPAVGQAPAELNDLEMAHAAVTASNLDISYAHLALAISETPAIREFAETMIRDHTAVNDQVFALARRLGVQARDNAFSRQLLEQGEAIKRELTQLRGKAFDQFYIENESKYHNVVNDVVANAFIPNIENAEVRSAFEGALVIFREHERHAERLAQTTGTR